MPLLLIQYIFMKHYVLEVLWEVLTRQVRVPTRVEGCQAAMVSQPLFSGPGSRVAQSRGEITKPTSRAAGHWGRARTWPYRLGNREPCLVWGSRKNHLSWFWKRESLSEGGSSRQREGLCQAVGEWEGTQETRGDRSARPSEVGIAGWPWGQCKAPRSTCSLNISWFSEHLRGRHSPRPKCKSKPVTARDLGSDPHAVSSLPTYPSYICAKPTCQLWLRLPGFSGSLRWSTFQSSSNPSSVLSAPGVFRLFRLLYSGWERVQEIGPSPFRKYKK